ncbi:ATP-binding protein [Actimicrobium sp. CCI2.3]|uniref:ATP-binding protein n=1 Tax=Actimicrobium sp. CCI2.3 TaxID=3048616 RepID=UPI002AB49F40|nr:ATP-binding protein [Actimicrobium sp. CCI2.3]MDY7574568.1 ATP-binding protein [Actimicrobium sp. CCI2.3]MEB0020944.1 ATP-binding protein [Actimicrobium sp. CCI2.3]
MNRTVAILGAESTGKSTLAEALATQYGSVWVPEYLREFVDVHQATPREEQQLGIALTQIEREEDAARRSDGWIFCDTTPVMTALYSAFYFGRVDAALAAVAANRRYALTLVTAPDTPWVADGLQRESASVRMTVHARLIALLELHGCDYQLLTGTLSERLRQAAKVLSSCPA